MFGLLLAFVVEAGWMLWFRFHVSFHVLLWKTLLACFAVAWRHRGVEISEIVWCWFCVEMVASLRCWFCDIMAFTQSLIHACVICLSRFWGEIPAGRPSGVGERGRVTSELQEMFKPCSRERARALAHRFKLSGFGPRPQAAGPIRASVRGGAPPLSRLSGWNLRDPIFHSFRGRYKLTDFICMFSHTWC